MLTYSARCLWGPDASSSMACKYWHLGWKQDVEPELTSADRFPGNDYGSPEVSLASCYRQQINPPKFLQDRMQ